MEKFKIEFNRMDKIRMKVHEEWIRKSLHDMEDLIKNPKIEDLKYFVDTNLQQLEQFHQEMKNNKENQVFEQWVQEKRSLLVSMGNHVPHQVTEQRKREREDDEPNYSNTTKKIFFKSGIEALLAAAAEIDAKEEEVKLTNQPNTKNQLQQISHLEITTSPIDLSMAINNNTNTADQPIDLSKSNNNQTIVVGEQNTTQIFCPRKCLMWVLQKQETNNNHTLSDRQPEISNESPVPAENEVKNRASNANSSTKSVQGDMTSESLYNSFKFHQSENVKKPLLHSTPIAMTSNNSATIESPISSVKYQLGRVAARKRGSLGHTVRILRNAFDKNLQTQDQIKQNVTNQENIIEHMEQDDDYVLIGPNGTKITKEECEEINWKSPSSATRSLLFIFFTEEHLSKNCLSGKPSPAFIGRERPLKGQLDPQKVQDIIHYVVNRLGCKPKEIKETITTQCADSAKKLRKALEKTSKRE